MPNSCANAARFSGERLYAETIFTLSDFSAARVSTLAQRPSPTMPTFTGVIFYFTIAMTSISTSMLGQAS